MRPVRSRSRWEPMFQPGLILVSVWLLVVFFVFLPSQCFFDAGQQGDFWAGESGRWSLSTVMLAAGTLLGVLLLIQALATTVRRRPGWKTAVIALLFAIAVLGVGQAVLASARSLGSAENEHEASAAALVDEARRLISRGEEAQAILVCEKAIALRPGDDAAWEERAWIKTYGSDSALRDPAGVTVCGTQRWDCFLTLGESWRALAAVAASMAERGDHRAAEYQAIATSRAREARADAAIIAALEARLESYRREDR